MKGIILVLFLILILDLVIVATKPASKQKQRKRKKGDKKGDKKSNKLKLPDGLELPDFITADDLLRDGEGSGLDPDSFMQTFFESHFPDGLPNGVDAAVTEHNRLFDSDNEIPIDEDVFEGLLSSATTTRMPSTTQTVVTQTTQITSPKPPKPSARPNTFAQRPTEIATTKATTTSETLTTTSTTTTTKATTKKQTMLSRTTSTTKTTTTSTITAKASTTMSTKLPECQNDPPGDPSKACRQAIHRRRKILEQQTSNRLPLSVSSPTQVTTSGSKQGTTVTASASISASSSYNIPTVILPTKTSNITVPDSPVPVLSPTITTSAAALFDDLLLTLADTTSTITPSTTTDTTTTSSIDEITPTATTEVTTKLELTVASFTTQTRPMAVQTSDTTEAPLVISIEPTTSYLSISTESSKKFNLFDFLPSNHKTKLNEETTVLSTIFEPTTTTLSTTTSEARTSTSLQDETSTQAAILEMADFSGDDEFEETTTQDGDTTADTIIFNPGGNSGGEIIWDPNGEAPPVNLDDFAFITPTKQTNIETTTDVTIKSIEILEDNDGRTTQSTVSGSSVIPTTTMDKIEVLNKLLTCCELGEECCNFDLLGQLSGSQQETTVQAETDDNMATPPLPTRRMATKGNTATLPVATSTTSTTTTTKTSTTTTSTTTTTTSTTTTMTRTTTIKTTELTRTTRKATSKVTTTTTSATSPKTEALPVETTIEPKAGQNVTIIPDAGVVLLDNPNVEERAGLFDNKPSISETVRSNSDSSVDIVPVTGTDKPDWLDDIAYDEPAYASKLSTPPPTPFMTIGVIEGVHIGDDESASRVPLLMPIFPIFILLLL